MSINHRRTMNLISYEIENVTLLNGERNRIFSSFQRMSRFIPQIKRYTRLAQLSQKVYVFGVPDVIPPPIEGIEYIYLNPNDELSKEWFILSSGRNYASALVTQELSHIDDPDEKRMFRGLWTFNLDIIGVIDEWLQSAVSQSKFEHPIQVLPDNTVQKIHLKKTIENIDVLIQQKPPAIREELENIRKVATQELTRI